MSNTMADVVFVLLPLAAIAWMIRGHHRQYHQLEKTREFVNSSEFRALSAPLEKVDPDTTVAGSRSNASASLPG